jgi:hypothetical protein
MAVIAELLIRRCNAAIPEVDVGMDVFAFLDEREEVARIQVKTAQGEKYKRGDGYSAQFSIPLKQLEQPDKPPLYYVLATRLEERFADFIVIGRSQLWDYWDSPKRFGTRDKEGNLVLTVQFRERVLCGEVDLTDFRGAWNILPPIQQFAILAEGLKQQRPASSSAEPPAEGTPHT